MVKVKKNGQTVEPIGYKVKIGGQVRDLEALKIKKNGQVITVWENWSPVIFNNYTVEKRFASSGSSYTLPTSFNKTTSSDFNLIIATREQCAEAVARGYSKLYISITLTSNNVKCVVGSTEKAAANRIYANWGQRSRLDGLSGNIFTSVPKSDFQGDSAIGYFITGPDLDANCLLKPTSNYQNAYVKYVISAYFE